MRNLSRLHNRFNLDNATIHVECYCLLNTDYEGLSNFLKAGGELASETPLMAKCPHCQQVYSGEISYTHDGPVGEGTPTISITLQAGEGDTERPRVPIGDCPSCGNNVYTENYAEGPGHPEIGWRYYECSDCETGMSPHRFETLTPNVFTEDSDQ